MDDKSVSIIGCCVCRDLFMNDDSFRFHTDIRFSSPISLIAEPVDFIKADFSHFKKKAMDVNGNWFKKTLINDINKTAFQALEERHGKYLIIDFTEARMALAKFSWPNKKETLLVSYSSAFRKQYAANLKNNIFKNATFEITPPLSIDDSTWENTLKEFAKRILKIFDEENIILIEDMPAQYYVGPNGELQQYTIPAHFQDYIECNVLSPKLNEMFKKICPKAKVIPPLKYALGSSSHIWGTNPFHFTNTFYSYLLESVKSIVGHKEKDLVKIHSKYEDLTKKEYETAMWKTINNYYKSKDEINYLDVINNVEEFKNLGRKKKAWILFGLNKKHFFKNIKKL